MRLFILLFLVSSVSFGCSKKPKPDEKINEEKGPSAQEYFIAGNKFLDKKKWKKAIEQYDLAAETGEDRWDIYVNRGIAQAQIGEFTNAVNSFDTAFKKGGKEEPDVYFNLGNVYQERGLYSQAIDTYRAGLAWSEKPDPDILNNLGAAYLFLHQYDKATQTYEHLRGVAPDDPRPIHGLAMIQQVQAKYEDAIVLYEQVNSSFPEFALSYYAKAVCLSRKGDIQGAISAWQMYLQVFPDSRYRKRVEGHISVHQMKLKKK